MELTENKDIGHLHFFNSIRYIIILLVVAFHASLSYSNLTPWWWAVDSVKSKVLDNMIVILDVFMMPVMFFVAGYFTFGSLTRKGTSSFLKGKFRRLGIPWILGVLFIGPVLTYIQHYNRSLNDNLLPSAYGSFWIKYISTAFELPFGKFNRAAGLFSQHQFWFLSLLLFYFVLIGIAYEFKKKITVKYQQQIYQQPPSSNSIFLSLILFGIIVCTGLYIVLQFISDIQFVTVFHLLQFRPSMFYMTFCYFLLGMYAFSKSWFRDDSNLGTLYVWIPVCVVSSYILLKIVMSVLTDPDPKQSLLLMYSFLKSYNCLSFLIIITTFTKKFMNMPSAINKKLSDSSFYIYIIHSMFVVPLAMVFLPWSVPVIIKFFIITVVSIGLSFGISNFFIRPYPRLSIGALLALFITLVLIVNPG